MGQCASKAVVDELDLTPGPDKETVRRSFQGRPSYLPKERESTEFQKPQLIDPVTAVVEVSDIVSDDLISEVQNVSCSPGGWADPQPQPFEISKTPDAAHGSITTSGPSACCCASPKDAHSLSGRSSPFNQQLLQDGGSTCDGALPHLPSPATSIKTLLRLAAPEFGYLPDVSAADTFALMDMQARSSLASQPAGLSLTPRAPSSTSASPALTPRPDPTPAPHQADPAGMTHASGTCAVSSSQNITVAALCEVPSLPGHGSCADELPAAPKQALPDPRESPAAPGLPATAALAQHHAPDAPGISGLRPFARVSEPPGVWEGFYAAMKQCERGPAPGSVFDGWMDLDGRTASGKPVPAHHRHLAKSATIAWGAEAPVSRLLTVSPHMPQDLSRAVWSRKQFVRTDLLHKGYASSVYRARCTLSGRTVAVKQYDIDRLDHLERLHLFRELTVHARLHHPNVLQFYAAFMEGTCVWLVVEYVSGGSLRALLQGRGGRLPEGQAVRSVLLPVMRALHYLHTQGVLHRDLKPENILLTSDFTLKLADFGLAIDLRAEAANTRAGTLQYMCPETLLCASKTRPEDFNKARLWRLRLKDQERRLEGGTSAGQQQGSGPHVSLARQPQRCESCMDQRRRGTPSSELGLPWTSHSPAAVGAAGAAFASMAHAASVDLAGLGEEVDDDLEHGSASDQGHYGLPADIWALGVFAYELVCGTTPFFSMTDEGVVERIAEHRVTFPRGVTVASRDWIMRALQWNATDRPTLQHLVKHPWFLGAASGSFAHGKP